jgi:hypothetical protein
LSKSAESKDYWGFRGLGDFVQSALFALAALRCALHVTVCWIGLKHHFGCALSVKTIDQFQAV